MTSQNSVSSVRDFLPDHCFLHLEDTDENTLDLITTVDADFYSRDKSRCRSVHACERRDSVEVEDRLDSSGSEASDIEVEFDRRPEDASYDEESRQFREHGCGCRFSDGM